MFTTNPVINIRPNLQENASNGVTNITAVEVDHTVEMDPLLRAQGMLLYENRLFVKRIILRYTFY